MRLHTLRFDPVFGWSKQFPDGGSHALVLAFAAAGLEHSGALAELHDRYPDAVVMGCSTAGEIFADRADDGTIALAVADFEATLLTTAVACVASPDESAAAGRLIADTLADPDLRSVLVLSDGTNVNGTALLAGLDTGLPDGVIVTGGLAGDGGSSERTWVLHEGLPVSGLVTAVGFHGDAVRVGRGSHGGWEPSGPERRVTHAEGLWQGFLRQASLDRLIEGAAEAADASCVLSADGTHDGDCLAIAITCVARKLVLGRRIDHEIDAVRTRLPHDAQLVGFYSHGEVSPDASGRCEPHDQTITLTTIAEGPPAPTVGSHDS